MAGTSMMNRTVPTNAVPVMFQGQTSHVPGPPPMARSIGVRAFMEMKPKLYPVSWYRKQTAGSSGELGAEQTAHVQEKLNSVLHQQLPLRDTGPKMGVRNKRDGRVQVVAIKIDNYERSI